MSALRENKMKVDGGEKSANKRDVCFRWYKNGRLQQQIGLALKGMRLSLIWRTDEINNNLVHLRSLLMDMKPTSVLSGSEQQSSIAQRVKKKTVDWWPQVWWMGTQTWVRYKVSTVRATFRWLFISLKLSELQTLFEFHAIITVLLGVKERAGN